jgi:hypothetical protein
MAFKIKVNGVAHTADVDSDTPLLWVLRDVLGITSTKFGCGMALCGACTVHVDGVATRSCITAIDSIGTSEITTIEAIGATAAGAKIQKACSIGRSFNAATASRARSCPLRRCLRVTRILTMPTLTMPCPATSAAVAPTSASAKRSNRQPKPSGREAYNDPRSPRFLAADPGRSPSAHGLSRRRLLQAGVAAGGGLLLSLSLPYANGDAEAADADGFTHNAFIRIGGDGRIVLTMPYVEMGQGTYAAIPMLIAEELEVALKQVQLEHAPPNEKALRQSIDCFSASPSSLATTRTMSPMSRRWSCFSCLALQERRGSAPKASKERHP